MHVMVTPSSCLALFSCSSPSTLQRQLVSLSPFYRWGKLRHTGDVTCRGSASRQVAESRIKLRSPESLAIALEPYLVAYSHSGALHAGCDHTSVLTEHALAELKQTVNM